MKYHQSSREIPRSHKRPSAGKSKFFFMVAESRVDESRGLRKVRVAERWGVAESRWLRKVWVANCLSGQMSGWPNVWVANCLVAECRVADCRVASTLEGTQEKAMRC